MTPEPRVTPSWLLHPGVVLFANLLAIPMLLVAGYNWSDPGPWWGLVFPGIMLIAMPWLEYFIGGK